MVDCSHFLEGYSDFRDGLLDREQWEAYQAHLDVCSSCARYDRVVGGGVEVFRSLPEIVPSPEFSLRLQSRLLTLEDELAHRSHASGATVATTFAVALVVGAIAWLPVLRRPSAPILLPPVAAHAPQHPEVVPPVFQPGPLLTLPEYAPVRVRSTGILSSPGLYPAGSFATYTSSVSLPTPR